VLMVEASLEEPRNPFSTVKTPQETRKIVSSRLQDITARLSDMVKDKTNKTESVGPNDSLSIVVYILNYNPADVPDLPGQLIITMKKDATEPTVRKM